MITVLHNCRIFDGVSDELIDGASIFVDGEVIKEVTAGF